MAHKTITAKGILHEARVVTSLEMKSPSNDMDSTTHDTMPPTMNNKPYQALPMQYQSHQPSDFSQDTGLPSSSYDGSHLHWKVFRSDVLAPHGISILESLPNGGLPQSLVALMEASKADISTRGEIQQDDAPLLMSDSSTGTSSYCLPSIEHQQELSRCFAPALDREALPGRLQDKSSPSFELTRPRSGLAQGFADTAFSETELKALPAFMHAKGHYVCEITPNDPAVTVLCSYFLLERTFGQKEYRLEAANNDCAVAGSWCVRSLEMLYDQAWSQGESKRPESPVAFSCTMDGTIAILNYHWRAEAGKYSMSPICKFDLCDREHSHQFRTWVEAISLWGIRTLLPVIRSALTRVQLQKSHYLPETLKGGKPELCLETTFSDKKVTRALKESFSSLPWRLDINSLTPISSSVAIWGSPVSSQVSDERHELTSISKDDASMQSPANSTVADNVQSSSPMPLAVALTQSKSSRGQSASNLLTSKSPATITTYHEHRLSDTSLAPPPSRADLAVRKHLSNAVGEIHDLQAQIRQVQQEIHGLNSSHQVELSGLRNTVKTLLHKVSTRSETTPPSTLGDSPNAKSVFCKPGLARNSANVITTPTEPRPAAVAWTRLQPSRKRSALQNVMTINTNMPEPASSSTNTTEPACDTGFASPELQTSPRTNEPPSSARSTPRTGRTIRIAFTPGPYSAAFPSPTASIHSDVSNVVVMPPPPPSMLEIFKWALALLSVQSLGTFIPSTILRIVFLGCITDFALQAFASPHWATTAQYFMHVIKD